MSIIHEYGYNRISDTKHGIMMYNIHDAYIGKCLDLYGEWSWAEIEATCQFATGGVLDIGANIGTHALAYSQFAKWVIAFEPVLDVFQVLCANIALNCLRNIFPLNVAASSINGFTHVPRPAMDMENNLGSFSIGYGDSTVPLATVDGCNLQGVTLVKVDVEGHEEQVLRGAEETIKRCRPVLYVENDRRDQSKSLCEYIESLDYEIREHYVPIYNPNNYRGNTHDLFPKIHSINMLCLPREGGTLGHQANTK